MGNKEESFLFLAALLWLCGKVQPLDEEEGACSSPKSSSMRSSVWRCFADAELGRAGSVESRKTTCRTSEVWEIKLKKGVVFLKFF